MDPDRESQLCMSRLGFYVAGRGEARQPLIPVSTFHTPGTEGFLSICFDTVTRSFHNRTECCTVQLSNRPLYNDKLMTEHEKGIPELIRYPFSTSCIPHVFHLSSGESPAKHGRWFESSGLPLIELVGTFDLQFRKTNFSKPLIPCLRVAFKTITRRREGGDAGVCHLLRRGADDQAETVSV